MIGFYGHIVIPSGIFLKQKIMIKSLLVSSLAAFGFLVAILVWEAASYQGTMTQLSLLQVDEFAEATTTEAEFEITIDHPLVIERAEYWVLDEDGQVVFPEVFHTMPLEDAPLFLNYSE